MSGWLREWSQRALSVARRQQRDDEFDEELQSHLDLAAAEFEAHGLSHADARRRALQALGSRDSAREGHREARGLPWLEFLVTLLGGFSVIALVLACVGIYSTVAFTVGERVQEFGVRMALGASATDIRQHVVRQTLTVAAIGVALGGLGAWLVARLMDSLLYGTSAFDGVTFALAALVLTGTATLAGYVPAVRASRISPMTALRGD